MPRPTALLILAFLFLPDLSWAQAGLVAAYSFNEGAGTTVADISGNGNNGTITAATWTTSGKFGNALVFNGTTAQVSIPNAASLKLTTGMTLEAWVYPTASPTNWRAVLDKNVDGYYLMASTGSGNRPGVGGTWVSGNQNTIAPSVLAVNAWTHMAATFDGTTVQMYINGALVASQAQTTALTATTGTLQIGGDSYPGEFFAGRIDEVRVYNRALSSAEIQTDMNTPVGGTPPPDTTAPTTPAGLGATAISATQINLAWTASTDNVGVTGYRVERCLGAGCTTFAEIAAPAGTTFSDTSVIASTSYSYRVRATDAATNFSSYSNTASTITPTPDTVAPSAPTGLTATAPNSSQINLVWIASTDDVGVAGYRIERCQGASCGTFVQIAAPAGTGVSFGDTGLIVSTTYSYRVRAVDAAGNLGAYSGVATATTSSTPLGLVAAYSFNEGSGNTVADVSGNGNNGTITAATWTTSGKFGNALTFNGTNAQVSVPNASSLRLTNGMTLEAWVYPTSTPTGWRSVIDKNVDGYYLMASTTPNNRPAGGGTWASGNQNTIGTAVLTVNSWTHLATTFDGATVRLYVNGALVTSQAQASTLSVTTGTLQIGGDGYPGEFFAGLIDEVRVYSRALSAAEIQTDMNTAVGGTPAPDTTAPSVPSGLGATAASTTQINLGWSASTDNVAVTGYRVERCQGAGCTTFTEIATPAAASFNDTGLVAATGYSYRVRATDAAGNLSGYSNIASATTAAPDSVAPTVPMNLTATAVSSSQINLAWSASTDNVGVTGYLLEHCIGAGCSAWISIGTTTGTTFNDTGLAAATTYRYWVRATDAAGNLSGWSSIVGATTNSAQGADTTPPTVSIAAPVSGATLSATTTITATASDNVGVVGVQFLLDGVALGAEQIAPYSLSWNTTSVVNGTHTLSARARDAAGNTTVATNVTVTVSNSQSTGGLVAAYSFNEGAGTTVTDVSGNGNNGTITGATWTTSGKFGNALVFNGTNAQVTIPSSTSLRLTTGMTLEAWVYPTSVPAGWRSVIDKNVDGYYLMGSTSVANQIAVGGTWTSGNQNTVGPSVLAVNTWTHLAATFDGATVRLYVNGTLLASQAQTNALAPTTGTLQIGGDSYPGEFFAGNIDEVRIYNRALNATEIQADIVTPIGGAPPPPDTIPPTASLTAPIGGSTVFGLVRVAATAADNIGVAGVQFLLDGQPIGAEATAVPYSVNWNTSAVSAGTHVLTARARDFSNNTGVSNPITVTVTPATTALVGQWAAPVTWPIVAVHSNLLRTGEVLAWDGQTAGNDARIWNPTTGVFTSVPNNLTNMFCSGHCQLSDGRLLVSGGHIGAHVGLTDTNLFNPATRTWAKVAPMAVGRWYPTNTTLPDGRVLVTSGEINCAGCFAPIPEIYNPQTNVWTQLTAASMSFPYYPHMFVLPDGRVLAAATTEDMIVSRVLNISTQTWSVVDPNPVDGGSSVMYIPGKIMKSGRSVDPDQAVIPSVATTYVLDMTQPSPAWRQTAPMMFTRTFHTLTVLPDGTVLATGGGPTTDAIGVSSAVLSAELWSPTTETWTTLSSMQKPRLYHSNALLMPDARVLVLGGGRFNGLNEPTDQLSSEFYSPPYLFKGTRPTISSAPTTATYGTSIAVQTPDAARISSVSLVKTGSVTHSINQDQRYLPLQFAVSGTTLNVQTPANSNLAPPGYYMLFILDTSGIPSVAAMLQIQ